MKFVVLSFNNEDHLFLFPNVLTTEQFVKCVGCVRMGYERNWVRSWCNASIVSEGIATPQTLNHSNQNHQAKYICFEDDNTQHMVVFPKIIDHNRMFQALQCTNDDTVEWYNIDVVSAGFINYSGQCYGESQTLDTLSKGKEDTELLLSMM